MENHGWRKVKRTIEADGKKYRFSCLVKGEVDEEALVNSARRLVTPLTEEEKRAARKELAKRRREMTFEAYAVGPCSASVCTSLSPEKAKARLNSKYPTGIESDWRLSESKTFADGTPHPCPCDNEDRATTHKHYLFEC